MIGEIRSMIESIGNKWRRTENDRRKIHSQNTTGTYS